jgi:hypothetical protein
MENQTLIDNQILFYIMYGIQMLLIGGVFFYQRNILATTKEYVALLDIDKLGKIMQLHEKAVEKKKEAYDLEHSMKMQTMDELIDKRLELLSVMATLIHLHVSKDMRKALLDGFLKQNKDDLQKYFSVIDANNL